MVLEVSSLSFTRPGAIFNVDVRWGVSKRSEKNYENGMRGNLK